MSAIQGFMLIIFFLLFFFSLGSVLPAAAADVWECPLSWPERCWTSNGNWALQVASCDALITSDCWNCESCHETYGVDYGSKYNWISKTSTPCPDDLHTTLPPEVIPFSSTADSCLKFAYECALGYHNVSQLDENVQCVPCSSVVATYSCGIGYFPKRCPHTSDLNDKDALCEACSFPPLDPLAVSADGLAIYRYGRGQLYENCVTYYETIGWDITRFNRSLCANFQTPKWEKGWCKIECALGFVPIVAATTGVIGALPTCRRCETYCAPGFYPPTCNGGGTPFAALDGKCLPCTHVTLPEHAVWTQGCAWTPLAGYYHNVSQQAVLPCVATVPCTDTNHLTNSSVYFMGCHDTMPGACVDCSAIFDACPADTYLKTDVYLDQCECAACNMAVLGATYWTRRCTMQQDALVLPCSTQCAASFSYISSQCSLDADIVCTPCTPPRLGLRLTTPCSTTHNAVYDACPVGMACDGSMEPFFCPDGRIAQSGICLCPLNTQMDATGNCSIISCDMGRYPDTYSPGCQSCTDSDSVPAFTRPLVMGVSACFCPRDHFIRSYIRSSSSARIHCWPCGDLSCDLAVQRQTPCTGLLSDEPSCECAPGPAMLLDNFSFAQPLCSVRCMPGYEQSPVASLAPAVRDQYDFMALASASQSWYSRLPVFFSSLRHVCFLDANTLLGLSAEHLFVMRASDYAMFPTTDVFIASMSGFGARSAILHIHTILAHDSMFTGYVWFVFQFRGNCLGYELDTQEGACWAIQLMAVQSTVRSTQPTCMSNLGLCVYMKAGIDFQPTALISGINCIALGTQGRTLLVAWNDTQISRYPVQTLGLSTQPGVLLHDAITLRSMGSRIVALADGVANTVYLLCSHGALYALLTSTTTSTLQLLASPPVTSMFAVPAGGHLLMLFDASDGWHQLDTVNHLYSSYAFLPHAVAAFSENSALGRMMMMIAHWNGSHIVVQTGMATCSLDTVSYRFLASMADSECEVLACTRLAPCGPHSRRAFGSTTCTCDPGYYFMSMNNLCIPCSSLGLSFYCPGDSVPIACPDAYSRTYNTMLASSILDCLCPPGMYHFDIYCVPCPTGYFCPLNGTLVPVQCFAGGLTIEGSLSPLDCQCPVRTHSLTCVACGDTDDCETMFTSVSSLLLNVEAWASSSLAATYLATCLQPITAHSVQYSLLGITTGIQQSSVLSALLFWHWYVVMESTSHVLLVSNLSACLIFHGFVNVDVQIRTQSTKPFARNVAYGGRMEWNGDFDLPAPTCIAGHEVMLFLSLQPCPCVLFVILILLFRRNCSLMPRSFPSKAYLTPTAFPVSMAPYAHAEACSKTAFHVGNLTCMHLFLVCLPAFANRAIRTSTTSVCKPCRIRFFLGGILTTMIRCCLPCSPPLLGS